MWSLVSPKGDTAYNLTPGKVHTVSRKVGDIILEGDGSVSRKHASLEVRSPIRDGVYVWDDSSKFGTFVDEGIESMTRLDNGVKVTLKEGGKVRFGLQNNIWIMKFIVPRVCVQKLKASEKEKIASLLSQFGGKIEEKWSNDTSHLTTSSISLTSEVMSALASAKPIVTPSFWENYKLMMTEKGNSPDLSKFIPAIDDKRLLCQRDSACLPNPQRKILFKDKLFIFPTFSRYQDMINVVTMAGGRCGKLSDCNIPLEDYWKPNVIVLSCPENEKTSFYNKVLSKLREKHRKVIALDDIGLALWKASTDVHCNPAYSTSSIFFKSHASRLDESSGMTIVANTEDIVTSSSEVDLNNQVIPPTYSDNLFSTEDRTLSLSFSSAEAQQPTSVPDLSAKRVSKSSKTDDSTQSSSKRGRCSIEKKDLFAFEQNVPRQSKTKNNGSAHSMNVSVIEARESTNQVDPDSDFFLPSPPKKKLRKSTRENTENLFELPEEPCPMLAASSIKIEDEPDFFDSSIHSDHLGKHSKSISHSFHNESRDLFDVTQESDKSSFTFKAREKRKGTEDSDTEDHPAKRLHLASADVSSVQQSSTNGCETTWIFKKDSGVTVKQELRENKDGDLASSFRAMVVVTPLLKKPLKDVATTSSNFTGKNFKKFRKVWSKAFEKHCVTTTVDYSMSGKGSSFRNSNHSNRYDSDDDEADSNPFLQDRPQRGRGIRHNEDVDGDFALPSYSQA